MTVTTERIRPAAAGRRKISVLLSMAGPDGNTKFVDQLMAYPGRIAYRGFTWRTAILGRYDIFHIHWPEGLFRSRFGLVRGAKRLGVRILLRRLRNRSTPIVRTIHNIQPHDGGDRAESRLLAEIDRHVGYYISLNRWDAPSDAKCEVIPHASYVEAFSRYPTNPCRSGVLYFGRIEPYKGLPDLIRSFSSLPDPDLTFKIVGAPGRTGMDEIRRAADADPRIEMHLEFVSDERLVWSVSGAELTVLPYRRMGNSGVLFVALSLGCPVLAPQTPVNEELLEEFGPTWISLYEGDISPEVLAEGIAWSRRHQRTPIDLDQRSLHSVGLRHEAFYSRVVDGGWHEVA